MAAAFNYYCFYFGGGGGGGGVFLYYYPIMKNIQVIPTTIPEHVHGMCGQGRQATFEEALAI